MSKFTKIIAVVVTLVMLLSVMGIASSAAESPVMELSSKRTQVTSGSIFEVKVSLSDATQVVGGVEGTITYNAAMFSNPTVTLSDAYTANGNTVNLIDASTAGVIRFAGLAGNDTGSEWFTISFVTAEVASASNQTFTVKASGSNKYGTAVQAVSSLNVTVQAVPNAIKVLGAQMKYGSGIASTAQDIQFAVEVTDLPAGNVVEFGVLMMFTKRLGDRELTYDMIANGETGLVVAKREAEGENYLTVPKSFGAQLTGSAQQSLSGIWGVRISARAYVRYSDGKVYYSNNNLADKVVAGYSSKSFNGLLKGNSLVLINAYDEYVAIEEASRTPAQQAFIDTVNTKTNGGYSGSYPCLTDVNNLATYPKSLTDAGSDILSKFVANCYGAYLATLQIAE